MIMVWLYARTDSLPIAQLTHASYTGALLLLEPVGLDPARTTLWMSVFSIVLWIVVAVLVARNWRAFTTSPALPASRG
jgi:hypothetical protein